MENMGLTPAFWNNKKVFLTGHTGFKGSWLVTLLNKLGAEIYGYALPPATNPNLYSQAEVKNSLTSIFADIRNYQDLYNAINEFEPDIIFHLAAQPLVKESYRNPVYTYETNVLGTVNLLECCRQVKGIQSVIIITSDKCYRNNNQSQAYREIDELGGFDPYSSSKACAELVTSSYRDSFFRDNISQHRRTLIATARAGNVIGGGDWADDRLIPDLIRGFINNNKTLIRNPSAVRPWQHVLDPLRGYLILAERLASDPELEGAWNFGPDSSESKPVSWVADKMVKLWGENAEWELDTQRHPEESSILKLDSMKARTMLKWSPKLDIANTITWTLDWYKKYACNEPLSAFTDKQIMDYLNLE